jgi:hypothetical protein
MESSPQSAGILHDWSVEPHVLPGAPIIPPYPQQHEPHYLIQTMDTSSIEEYTHPDLDQFERDLDTQLAALDESEYPDVAIDTTDPFPSSILNAPLYQSENRRSESSSGFCNSQSGYGTLSVYSEVIDQPVIEMETKPVQPWRRPLSARSDSGQLTERRSTFVPLYSSHRTLLTCPTAMPWCHQSQ